MMNTADKIIALVDEMRENSREQSMWKNIPLAKECIQLLRALDDPEEDSHGKALACNAICEQLPEYDMPRFVLDILHYERELLVEAEKEGCGDPEALEAVDIDIQRLNDYTDTQNVGTREFRKKYDRMLDFDPVERTPRWEELYCEVEEECDRQLGDTPKGMGFCFAYWSVRRDVLAKRGIMWQSPAAMNPHVMFD
ncbi:MAG: hypothetical protein IJQ14_00520 [Bacteroidales bacterium]|nr:hypothetical protein [Bacteroidales bacterium]